MNETNRKKNQRIIPFLSFPRSTGEKELDRTCINWDSSTLFRQAALVRLGESHTVFHRPVRRNRKETMSISLEVLLLCSFPLALLLPHEHRFEPGELTMGRSVNYPLRKVFLDPFRRQIFTEDIEFDENEPYLLTLKLAPKYFLPMLSQVAKSWQSFDFCTSRK